MSDRKARGHTKRSTARSLEQNLVESLEQIHAHAPALIILALIEVSEQLHEVSLRAGAALVRLVLEDKCARDVRVRVVDCVVAVVATSSAIVCCA
jgi:hypothetical protein